MKPIRRSIQTIAAALVLAGAAAAQTGFPFTNESLRYSINWPSGLSLGEATFTAHRGEKGWEFEATLDAGVPGFSLADKFRSSATTDLCSLELQKDTSHAGRKTREKTTFDQDALKAHRVTVFPEGGGESDLDVRLCARDALALTYYARKELGQGRVQAAQQAYMGAAYSVRMDYTGAQTITLGEKKPAVTDRVVVSVKGPKADLTFEVFFARDAARTPLEIRVPLAVGTLSAELVR